MHTAWISEPWGDYCQPMSCQNDEAVEYHFTLTLLVGGYSSLLTEELDAMNWATEDMSGILFFGDFAILSLQVPTSVLISS